MITIRRAISSALLLLAAGCTAAGPRVVEVSHRDRLQTVGPAEQDIFTHDRASHIRVKPRPLPIDEQGQEFFVRWNDRHIDVVKLEYRQINLPNEVKSKSIEPNGKRAATFFIGGEEYQKGGNVSAWRVSLWQGGEQPVADMKSVLW